MKNVIYLLCLLATTAVAQLDNLNAAATLVDQQNPQDNAQMMAALTAVISKKSGLSEAEIAQQSWLDASFKDVILRHYYEQIPANLEYSGLWFHVVTDGAKLNQMLIDRNVPLWPPNRPDLFIWLVEEQEDGSLSHAQQNSAAEYWLNKVLTNKGIEHQFYNSMDADLLQFKPEDVSYLNPDLVNKVYLDYQPDQVLLIKLRHFRSGYSYRAGLFESADSDAHIENRQFVSLPEGLDFLATSIQQKLADGQRIDAGEFGDFTLAVTINDISDASAMLVLWRYLHNQPLIKNFQATAYGQKSLQLQVNARVDSDTFAKVLTKDGLLQHMPLGINNRIVFSWQP
ncbi:DUF2066 domain-containing protein [Marinicella gelatinilytica]|uniref:DUF2066 domain-containing protein n=1 Tax=Marinicella gelatinilytica TaxID=2996017 RepID=UPI00226101DD|nr:DUF2066 domain-containing protein [Marinicella gelatinilytica]MCX7546274.1 DUF2066 domain-containing protein [Marinicella gelatinilytica]